MEGSLGLLDVAVLSEGLVPSSGGTAGCRQQTGHESWTPG